MNPNFHYISETKTIHCIEVGMHDFVEVIGDPDNGAYEWIIRRKEEVIRHSDDGYGSPEIALRDGLVTYFE